MQWSLDCAKSSSHVVKIIRTSYSSSLNAERNVLSHVMCEKTKIDETEMSQSELKIYWDVIYGETEMSQLELYDIADMLQLLCDVADMLQRLLVAFACLLLTFTS